MASTLDTAGVGVCAWIALQAWGCRPVLRFEELVPPEVASEPPGDYHTTQADPDSPRGPLAEEDAALLEDIEPGGNDLDAEVAGAMDRADAIAEGCDQDSWADCCASDLECDDDAPCTIDACDPNAGVCLHTPVALCCTSDAQCDDQNPCTADADGECGP